MKELNFGSFFRPYKAEGVSRLLFLEPQAPVFTQVSFVCCSEHFFHNAEVDTEKMVFFECPIVYSLMSVLRKRPFNLKDKDSLP